MPAVSQAQRIAMAIAEHSPSKLYKRNAGLANMSKGDLHDFASTKEKSLPRYVGSTPKPKAPPTPRLRKPQEMTAAAIVKHRSAAKKGKY